MSIHLLFVLNSSQLTNAFIALPECSYFGHLIQLLWVVEMIVELSAGGSEASAFSEIHLWFCRC